VLIENMDTILGEDDKPAPVAGRVWHSGAFAGSSVAINERGDTAFTGFLREQSFPDPTTHLIVKNGVKFMQSGDSLPALSAFPLGIAARELALSNQGDVFWVGGGQNSNGVLVDDAFLRNDQPIVQENKTVVEGALVIFVDPYEDGFAISPEGRFFVGRVVLQGPQGRGDALLFADFGLVRERAGCSGLNSGSLRRHSGEARLGQRLELAMDGGPGPGALPFVLFARSPRLSAAGCGTVVPYGELMLAPPIAQTLVLAPWDGTNPSLLAIDIPTRVVLVDTLFYAQGVFRDTGTPPRYRLTNALQVEIGPP
jgi:hypothetical protein